MQVTKHTSKGIHPGLKPRADVTRSSKQGNQWPDVLKMFITSFNFRQMSQKGKKFN